MLHMLNLYFHDDDIFHQLRSLACSKCCNFDSTCKDDLFNDFVNPCDSFSLIICEYLHFSFLSGEFKLFCDHFNSHSSDSFDFDFDLFQNTLYSILHNEDYLNVINNCFVSSLPPFEEDCKET